MFLLDDILLAPLKGTIALSRKIKEVADQEMSDEGAIKEKLMALQMQFEMDEIDEEEYERKEKELLDRLDEIRQQKQSQE